MNILIASLYLPYPAVPHGGGHDLFRLIETLNQQHTISVVSFVDANQARHAESLRPYVADVQLVTPAITLRQKLSSAVVALRQNAWKTWGRRADCEMRQAIADRARRGQIDVVWCVWTEMGRYLNVAPPGVLRVLDEVDVRFVVEQAAAAGRWWSLMRAAQRRCQELAYCRSADLVLTRSARDLAILRRACPDLAGFVLPPAAHVASFADIRPEECEPYRVLFVGALDRKRNQAAVRWLVDEIWPQVHNACPEAVLRIVGANPPAAVQALADRPGVQVTGRVPDLRAEYARARVIAAPMRSEAGALNKVIDGLAAGRPVVATTLANAGIGAPLEALSLADDPHAFACAISKLLRHQDEWTRRAQAGRRFTLTTFDWPRSVHHLESTLLQLVDQRRIHSP
jgi:glycosyltransferase involved in cell wall biosynthesis